MMNIDFHGKTVWMTGAGGGIGSAIHSAFEGNGARVIAPRSSELDLRSETAVPEFAALHRDAMPDILIHCAGINELAGITEVSQDSLERVFQVNLFSFAALMKAVIPEMQRRQSGRIVGISSLYGIVSKERRIPYSSSKHAMRGLIQSAALETAAQNILINGIAPGYVMTDMTRKNLSPAEIEALKQQIPTGRLQEASEIADLCLFLCADTNRSITGQIIPVDGGFLCR